MSTVKTADGLELYKHEWLVESPKATVLIIHGYGEHGERYSHLASAFNEAGISTLSADLRGHGRSPGVRGYVDRFNDYHLDATALYENALEYAQGGPLFVFAHSMGGLICFDWLNAGLERPLSGVIVSSPCLGFALEVNAAKKMLGNVMSSLYPSLAIPSGLKGSDVTRDPDEAEAYDCDPLNNSKATARWFTETKEAMARVHANAAGAVKCPIFLVYGGDDRVVSADDTERFAKGLKVEDQTVERLEGYFHELINEPEEYRKPIIERTRDWILARCNA